MYDEEGKKKKKNPFEYIQPHFNRILVFIWIDLRFVRVLLKGYPQIACKLWVVCMGPT